MKSGDPDLLAKRLAWYGQLARSMPPVWDATSMSHPVLSPTNGTIGRLLPGRGMYLITDLKKLGIRRRIPYVYEPSIVDFLRDVSYEAAARAERIAARQEEIDRARVWMRHPERGAITTYDGIINARAGAGKAFDINIAKASTTTTANAWSSLFRTSGGPTSGTYTNIPTGAALDRSNNGAWSLGLTNPTAPDKQYLLTFGMRADQQINCLLLHDLLVAAGNILATSTSGQTVSSAALTRYTTGVGVMMTFDVTTALGTTAANLTISYTNSAGTAGQSTGAIAMTTSAIVQRLQPAALGPFMKLASGDVGVRAVATATFSASMLAGVIALNLYMPLAFMEQVVANAYQERDSTIQIDGLKEIAQTSGNVLGCLNAYVLPNTTSTGVINAFIRTCQG